jgi:hypothetical protein
MRRIGWSLLIAFAALALPLIALALMGARGRTALHSQLMDAASPPAPDYAEAAAWAALPGRADKADAILVPGASDRQSAAEADVFFLHAGANWSLHWNAPLDHWLVTFLVDGALLEQWASAFNDCCRVYAPRFRQEALAYPESDEALHERSLELAYADVRAAFRHYLAHENHGRPIVVAGAQSGARHALQLLIDEFAGQPLRAQLVAAYVPGARIDEETRARLGDIAICEAPEQTGCVNVWNTTGRQAWGVLEPRPGESCVNPLTWRADGVHAPRELNLGSVGNRLWGDGPLPFAEALVDAHCHEGRLWVTPPEHGSYWQPGGPGDYHIQNYTFFFANIRRNAGDRVRAFAESEGPLTSVWGADVECGVPAPL